MNDKTEQPSKKYVSDGNIVKEAKRVLGMTYDQLGSEIGVKGGSLQNAASTGEISEQLQRSLELLLENYRYKKDFEIIDNFKKLMKN